MKQPKRFFWCVIRDDGDDTYTAHGPYNTDEAALAFNDAIDTYMPWEVVSLGTFEAIDENEAVNMAKTAEIEANQPE
jgi:hypothetical protein